MILQHIPFARLADLAESRIPAQERTETLAHLSLCSKCDARLSQLRLIIEMMRTHKVVDVPQHLDEFAIRLFRSHIARPPSLLRRVRAALSFDSLRMSPAFGLRAAQSTTRQLIFSTEDHDLDLCIAPSGESWILSGQVLGPAEKGAIELRGDFCTLQADLNDTREFSLPAAPAGNYELILRLRDIEVVIPNLRL